jgi:hypothetical protein
MKLIAHLAAVFLIVLKSVRAVIILATAVGLSYQSRGDDRVGRAVDVLMTLCVAKGSVTVSRFNFDPSTNQLNLQSDKGGFVFEKREAQGLVDGISASLNSLGAEQAARASECMKPYIGEIMAAIMAPSGARLFSVAEFLSRSRLGVTHATSIDYVQSLLGTPVYRTLTRAHFERDGYVIDAKIRDSGDDRGVKGTVVAIKVMTIDGSGQAFALSGFPGIEQDFARISRSAEVGKNMLSDFLAGNTQRCEVDYWGGVETNTFLCYFGRGEELLAFKLYLDTHGLSEADKEALYSFFKILNFYRYPNKYSDSHAWDVADDEEAEEKKVGVLSNSSQGKIKIAVKKIAEIASKMRVIGVEVISPLCVRDLDTEDRPDAEPVTDKHAKPELPR